ncbi:MAG: sensor histidine kinase, partial [Acidimicrobiia bacterium]
ATRMRRNAESLLVLAGAEPPRVWAKSMDMSEVVRAAVSEVDDYQRVELLALEPAMISGGAVADVAHLFAELLDNATQFSPPSEPVRVTGLFDMDGYQLSVTDRGVGLSNARIAQLNEVLESPPALGLAMEPTLGIYVVARLAARHGIKVDLIPAVPGVTVKVTIPRDLLETKRTRPPSHEGSIFAPDPVDVDDEHPDPATREYVFKRTRREGVVEAGSEVIDLTASAMTSADAKPSRSSLETGSSSPIETGRAEETLPDNDPIPGGKGDLPVRIPGRAYRDQGSGIPSTAPGDGASGIKSALSAYDRGRRAAESDDEPESIDEVAPSAEDRS